MKKIILTATIAILSTLAHADGAPRKPNDLSLITALAAQTKQPESKLHVFNHDCTTSKKGYLSCDVEYSQLGSGELKRANNLGVKEKWVAN